MTLTQAREAIRAALDTVDGVSAYAHPPSAPDTGDVWPQLSTIQPQREGRQFPSAEWTAVLCLSQDMDDASNRLDALLGPVKNALDPVLPLYEIRPGRLTVGGAEIFALEFRGRLPLDFE